jgi:hypothetical protein
MAFNLTRAAGTIAAGLFAKARAGTVRRKLVNIPARIASSARRIRLRLPEAWPWQASWEQLFAAVHAPPLQHRNPARPGPQGPEQDQTWNTPAARPGTLTCPKPETVPIPNQRQNPTPIGGSRLRLLRRAWRGLAGSVNIQPWPRIGKS